MPATGKRLRATVEPPWSETTPPKTIAGPVAFEPPSPGAWFMSCWSFM
jgi:hypothetical protein